MSPDAQHLSSLLSVMMIIMAGMIIVMLSMIIIMIQNQGVQIVKKRRTYKRYSN